jgi:hypothetical protein
VVGCFLVGIFITGTVKSVCRRCTVLYCTVGTRDIDKGWRKISKVLCSFKTRFYNSVYRNTERFLAFLPLSFQKVFNVPLDENFFLQI